MILVAEETQEVVANVEKPTGLCKYWDTENQWSVANTEVNQPIKFIK